MTIRRITTDSSYPEKKFSISNPSMYYLETHARLEKVKYLNLVKSYVDRKLDALEVFSNSKPASRRQKKTKNKQLGRKMADYIF